MSHAGRAHRTWKQTQKKTEKEIEAVNTVPSRQSSDRSAGQTSRSTKLDNLNKLFTSSVINQDDFNWARKHGDNGICLGLIFKKKTSPQKEDFLNLFTFDEDASFFSRGGFGKDSFKVKFLGKLIGANFDDCKTDAERKAAIKTKLTEMEKAAPQDSKLKTTLVDILNSKTFKAITPAPAPKTSTSWFSCLKQSPAAPGAATEKTLQASKIIL